MLGALARKRCDPDKKWMVKCDIFGTEVAPLPSEGPDRVMLVNLRKICNASPGICQHYRGCEASDRVMLANSRRIWGSQPLAGRRPW